MTSIAKKHKCAVILPPSPEEPKSKQSKLFPDALATKRVSQPQLDSLVLDLVIQGLLPFKFVELPAFKKLVTTFQPRLHVISRPTVKTRLKCRVTTIKKTLIEIFRKVDYVSTTTDCWSAHRKSFIGVTVHWIDSNFKRQSAALACRRLKGSHTFGLLAGAIDDIHSESELGTASFFLSPQSANPQPNFNFLNPQPQVRNSTFKSLVRNRKSATTFQDS